MDELLAVAVDDGDYVALEIGDVVELMTVIDQGQGRTGGIVGEVHGMPVHGHVGQFVTGVGVAGYEGVVADAGKVKGTGKLSP